MNIQTFRPTYPAEKRQSYRENNPYHEGTRIRIRPSVMDAAEKRCPKGLTLREYLNRTLEEALGLEPREAP
jgi:hypothetical protein